MNNVENLICHWRTCEAIISATSSRPPLQMTILPTQNWEYLSIDLKGPLESGKYVLVVIDYLSKYPDVALMQSIISENIKHIVQKVYITFGYPRKYGQTMRHFLKQDI